MTLGLAENTVLAPATKSYATPNPLRAHARLSSRAITPQDLHVIAALLHEGFPGRSLEWFHCALAGVARLPAIPGMPRFGYVLTDDGQPVGAVLSIASKQHHGRESCTSEHDIRLNVACWYVRPRYRAYSTILYQRLLALRDVTFVNVTPAANTWPVIEAQGFARFSQGIFAGVPILGRHATGVRVAGFDIHADSGLSFAEQTLLAVHAASGCIAFTCATGTHTLPFVFRRRTIRRLPPAAHLIYCRDLAHLGRYAGAIGRRLARHGLSWIIVGADRPLPGIPGRYFPGKSPMYYKGPLKPRPGDIAYTELALFTQ